MLTWSHAGMWLATCHLVPSPSVQMLKIVKPWISFTALLASSIKLIFLVASFLEQDSHIMIGWTLLFILRDETQATKHSFGTWSTALLLLCWMDSQSAKVYNWVLHACLWDSNLTMVWHVSSSFNGNAGLLSLSIKRLLSTHSLILECTDDKIGRQFLAILYAVETLGSTPARYNMSNRQGPPSFNTKNAKPLSPLDGLGEYIPSMTSFTLLKMYNILLVF